MRKLFKNGKTGAIAVTFTLLLAALIGLTALGIESGQWYLIKAEISKAADAAALIGAKNLSNPNLDEAGKIALMEDLGKQNFPPGYLGTFGDGESGCVSFTPTVDSMQAKVIARVSTGTFFAKLAGVDRVSPVKTSVAGSAIKEIEIFLTRDLTGCGIWFCGPHWIEGSKNLVNAFRDYQDKVKIGLMVCKGAKAGVVYPPQTDFLTTPYTSPYTGRTYANILEAIDDDNA
ncbi:MAG: pilus assembly protein TadG-related protein, partial [Kiritimatiellia bacterium]|nr:pilus assembly protein TadG-related protein [Kiritimatiellia bacterium]